MVRGEPSERGAVRQPLPFVILAVAVAVAIVFPDHFVLLLVGTAVLGLTAVVLGSGLRGDAGRNQEAARLSVLVLQLVYLTLLFAVAAWYWQGSRLTVEPKINLYCLLPNPVGGVPLEIVWFGALGGVLLSLQGVFRHVSDWNVRYHPWHVARPFVGAAVAVIAYFLLIVTIRASGTSPNIPGPDAGPTTTSSAPAGEVTTTTRPADDPYDPRQTRRCTSLSGPRPPGRPVAPDDTSYIYYAIAFIVGFREETFRRLLRRVTDVILTPGDEPLSPSNLRIAAEPVKPQEKNVGDELPIVAIVTDQASQPRRGEMVRFVVAGAHELTALGLTDQEGRATIQYKGTTVGDDTIRVFVDVNGDGERQVDEPQDVVEVKWIQSTHDPGVGEKATPHTLDDDAATPDIADPPRDATPADTPPVPGSSTPAENSPPSQKP